MNRSKFQLHFFGESQQTKPVCFSNSANSWQWSPLGVDQVPGSPVRQASHQSCHRGSPEPSQSCGLFACEGKLRFTSLLCPQQLPCARGASQLKGNWRHYCKEFRTLVYRIGKISAVVQNVFGALPRTWVRIVMLIAVSCAQGKWENGWPTLGYPLCNCTLW